MSDLYLYSGKCLIGKVGDETGLKDSYGEDLFIGDIVAIYAQYSDPQFTVICDRKFTSYSDGTYKVADKSSPIVMGIANVDYHSEDNDWSVSKVKSYKNLIDGENWPAFGFIVSTLDQVEQKGSVDVSDII